MILNFTIRISHADGLGHLLATLWPSLNTAFMRRRSPLVQTVGCRLFGIKSLPEMIPIDCPMKLALKFTSMFQGNVLGNVVVGVRHFIQTLIDQNSVILLVRIHTHTWQPFVWYIIWLFHKESSYLWENICCFYVLVLLQQRELLLYLMHLDLVTHDGVQ